jgi:hypothetical protein
MEAEACMARKRLAVEAEIGGLLHNDLLGDVVRPVMSGDVRSQCNKNVPTLEEAIAEITSKKRRCAASFSSRGSTLSLYYDPDFGDELWLFDSHGGHPSEDRKSHLLRCRDPPCMVDAIRRRFVNSRNARSDYDMVLFVASEKEEEEEDAMQE